MTDTQKNAAFMADGTIDNEILERRKNKYNCAAATLCGANAAAGMGLDEAALKHTVAGFGGGIGRTNGSGTCGALTGAVAALGMFGNGDDAHTIECAREMFEHFEKTLGSVQCGVLKSPDSRVSCNECCLVAGRKLMEILNRKA